MAIAISSVTSGTDTGVSATVSVTTSEAPTTTKVGDLVVVVYANDFYALSNMGTPTATGTPTMNAITGATGDGGANEAHIKAWWYVANTAGAQTISATETGTHDEEKSITAYVLTGADTTTPVDAAAGNTSTTSTPTSQVAPAVSPATSNAFLICQITSGGGAAAASYTTPSPLTEQFEIHAGSISGVGATNQLSASGSTGTFTFTASASTAYSSCSIAIKTAAAGAAVTPPRPAIITQPVQPSITRPTILRSTLQDPPVLTTPAPLVVTRPAPVVTPPLPLLSRSSLQDFASAAPMVVSRPTTASPTSPPFIGRASLADVVVPAASTPQPIVVTGLPSAPPLGPVTVLRATLADPPVLTTPEPLVVSAPIKAAPLTPAMVLRGSLFDLATPAPIVVTAPWTYPWTGPAVLSRSSLADTPLPPGVATPGPIVVTAAAPPPWTYRPLIMSAFRPGAAPAPPPVGETSGAVVPYPNTDTGPVALPGQEESGAVSGGASASFAVSSGIQ